MYDRRNKACNETLKEIKRGFEELVTNPIRMNSKLRESPSQGKDIFEYSKRSAGALDYKKLAQTVIEAEEYA
jgi:chromosome partitioning protein